MAQTDDDDAGRQGNDPAMAAWRRGIALTSVLVIGTACGSNAPSSSPGTSPTTVATRTPPGSLPPDATDAPATSPTGAADDAVWDVPEDPLHVDVDLESAAATTKTIETDGGTLTAVGGDGTRYTLTIPAQPVWQPTAITMTPIADLTAAGRVAGTGVVFGVQLEPSGLLLSADASLEIEPAAPVEEREIAYFGYEGEGEDAGLETPDLRAGGHRLAISHFSGAGFVHRTASPGGTDPESGVYEVLVERVTTRIIENRLASVVARELGVERERQLAGQDADHDALTSMTARWLASYLTRVVEPLMAVAANAGATCDEASEAAGALFNADRQRQLLGVADDDPAIADLLARYAALRDQVFDLIDAACRREAARQCRETGNLNDVVSHAFREARTKALLGMLDDAQYAAVLEAYRAILRWCGVYELSWTSKGKIANAQYTIASTIEGHLTLRYVEDETGDLSKIRLEGATASDLVPFLSSVVCTSYQDRMLCPPGADLQAPTRGVVTELQQRITVKDQAGGQQIIRTIGENKLVLDFDPSAMVLQTSIKTPAGPIPVPLEVYKAPWSVAHKPDMVDGAFRITDWVRADHPLMFTKTYTGRRTREGSTYSDATELRFTHTPDPEP